MSKQVSTTLLFCLAITFGTVQTSAEDEDYDQDWHETDHYTFYGKDTDRWENQTCCVGTTGIGVKALRDLTSGRANTAVGHHSLKGATTGSNNTAVGYEAMKYGLTTSNNIAIGSQALRYNRGNHNIGIGVGAHGGRATGSHNVAIGFQGLEKNAGTANIAIGNGALKKNSSGGGNIAVGLGAMGVNTLGEDNVAMGRSTLLKNIGGNDNTAIGIMALKENEESGNTAVGAYALRDNTYGKENAAVGHSALLQCCSVKGGENSAFGFEALSTSKEGYANVAVGAYALKLNQSKINTAIGTRAGEESTGFGNVFIGFMAGHKETGNNQLIINNAGPESGPPLIKGSFAPAKLEVNGDFTADSVSRRSDARLKTDIRPIENPLQTILKLHGKQYRFKDSAAQDLGLLAQDLEKVLPELVSETDDGFKAISYSSLTALLIEAMKEQQKDFEGKLTALEQENVSLKAMMSVQMQELLARVAILEGASLVAN